MSSLILSISLTRLGPELHWVQLKHYKCFSDLNWNGSNLNWTKASGKQNFVLRKGEEGENGSLRFQRVWDSPIWSNYMYKNYRPRTCVCLNKWVNLTKDNLESQWLQWETFN